jgi:hypothetical protein
LVGKTKSGKGTKLMVLADGSGTPLGIYVEKASPAEVTLAEATLDSVKVKIGKHKKGGASDICVGKLKSHPDKGAALLGARVFRPASGFWTQN